MAARIESRLARASRPCSAAVRLPTSPIGCIRALHRISSVAAGDIERPLLVSLPGTVTAVPERGRPDTYRVIHA